jgi:3-oxoacyl-[acyl-carrier protein] reductase
MGRAAEPAEIAEGVAFLVGDESAYMTGQTLHVNGGMVLP